jgi:hypothetical protein
MRSWFFIGLSTLIFGSVSFAYSNTDIVDEESKIYVGPDQVCINETGIFVNTEKESIRVPALYGDKRGLYINRTQLEVEYTAYECPNGHPSRHGDGRCNYLGCPYVRD